MSFDPKLALHCAKALLALSRGDLELNVINPATGIEARVEEMAPGRWVILLPGSGSIQDWLTNAKIRKAYWGDDARAHSGFVGGWRSIDRQVRGMLPENATVILVGHSQGGAVATLGADTLVDDGFDIEGVYTFGSPRVFNRAGARIYNETLAEVTYRIINQGDPVPSLPLRVPVFSGIYTHVACEYALRKSGELAVEPLPMERAPEYAKALQLNFGADAASAQSAFVSKLIDLDHPIEAYVRRLEALR